MGEKWKQWQTLFSWAPKSLWMVIAAMKLKDASSWKKSYDQPKQHIKNRDSTLLTKVCLVKAMVFPVVMYGCECWTIKKAEHQKIDAFELWCWRRLLTPRTARKSNQSILKEISPRCSLEGLMLKLKLQYFGHLMQRTDSFEKTLMLRKIEGRRRRGQQGWDDWMASPTWWIWVWVNSGRELVMNRKAWHAAVHGVTRVGHYWATELNWIWKLTPGVIYQQELSPDLGWAS